MNLYHLIIKSYVGLADALMKENPRRTYGRMRIHESQALQNVTSSLFSYYCNFLSEVIVIAERMKLKTSASIDLKMGTTVMGQSNEIANR